MALDYSSFPLFFLRFLLTMRTMKAIVVVSQLQTELAEEPIRLQATETMEGKRGTAGKRGGGWVFGRVHV